MRIDETRALLQQCLLLSRQKFDEDFYSLDEKRQNEIVDEACNRILTQ